MERPSAHGRGTPIEHIGIIVLLRLKMFPWNVTAPTGLLLLWWIFWDEDNAEMLADRELRRLYAAMSKLTERQSEILQLYF